MNVKKMNFCNKRFFYLFFSPTRKKRRGIRHRDKESEIAILIGKQPAGRDEGTAKVERRRMLNNRILNGTRKAKIRHVINFTH